MHSEYAEVPQRGGRRGAGGSARQPRDCCRHHLGTLEEARRRLTIDRGRSSAIRKSLFIEVINTK